MALPTPSYALLCPTSAPRAIALLEALASTEGAGEDGLCTDLFELDGPVLRHRAA